MVDAHANSWHLCAGLLAHWDPQRYSIACHLAPWTIVEGDFDTLSRAAERTTEAHPVLVRTEYHTR